MRTSAKRTKPRRSTRRSASRSHARKQQRVRIDDGPFAVVTQRDLSVVFWGTVPLYSLRCNDRLGRYAAAVDLVRLHHLRPEAVGESLGISRRTMYRLLERFENGGLAALLGSKGFRQPTKILGASAVQLLELKRQGASNREAARRLDVSPSGVAAALRRLGSKQQQGPQPYPDEGTAREPEPEPPVSSNERSSFDVTPGSAASKDEVSPPDANKEVGRPQSRGYEPASHEPEQRGVPEEEPAGQAAGSTEGTTAYQAPVPQSLATTDLDPLNRQGDRLMARLGLLDDAVPLFAPGQDVPCAGGLIAVPSLVQSGLFEIGKSVYGSIGPAFYGLRTSLLLFTLYALLRIKRVEGLKRVRPRDLGRIVGLDRAPEMKTLRRKLKKLAKRGKGLEFLRELARLRVKENEECLGFLYVDGHVRVYSGHRQLPKTYVMQRRLALPATTDYWVSDVRGNPVFVVTAKANEGMTKMLPLVLLEVRRLVGNRRVTIVFDRGGWSPKLFLDLINDNWDILTYRKGKRRPLPRRLFTKKTRRIGDREVCYELASKRVRLLGGKLSLLQVTVRKEDGHQTQILTNREDVADVEVAYRMFDRWRQENFFKYMLEEFALDALVDYGIEAADPTRTVPNPKRKALSKKLTAARAALAKIERQYGEAAIENSEKRRRTMRGFKIATGRKIGKPLREARLRVQMLDARKRRLPVRVPISETLRGKAPVRLRMETKRLSDTFKMVAYQAESDLVSLVAPFYRRVEDEGRALIASALRSAANLRVTGTELHVTLAPMSSPHRSRAIQAVCEELNKRGCLFPGTNLRLRFGVRLTESATECEG